MQIDTDVEALAARQHGVFTDDQARAAGAIRAMARHRRSSGRWIRHRAGVNRLVGAVVTPRLEVLAAVLAVPGAVASHQGAAALLGLPGFDLLPVRLTAASSSVRIPRDLEVHRTSLLPVHHVRSVDGIRCTSVARTVFDLCGSVHPKRAERALDNALARRLVTRAALERVLDDLRARTLRNGGLSSAPRRARCALCGTRE